MPATTIDKPHAGRRPEPPVVLRRVQGHYLDESRYDEVWAALEELPVPLYLHPGAPPADHWKVRDRRPELYGATWSWHKIAYGNAERILRL